MSRLIVVFVLLGLTALALGADTTKEPIENEAKEEFKRWRGQHKRVYQDGQDEERRMRIFRDNWKRLKQIQEDGDDDKPYKLEINKFADLTTEEFAAQYLGTKPKVLRDATVQVLQALTLPLSVDWRTKNAVTPVRNQGSCGSCWSFSAIAALEGLYAIKYGILKSFSEQQLVDCAGAYGNYACNGGLMTNAFKYTRDYGVQAATTYTLYRGAKLACTYNSSKVVFRNTGYLSVRKNDNAQLAAAVATRPVSVAVQADASVFQFYRSGIIDGTACGTTVNHGVTIVGYGTQNGKNYWIVKNSWGTGWGEAGYVRIAKSSSTASPGVCGIATMASYPVA